jgi:PAS domain S-box-containing protein
VTKEGRVLSITNHLECAADSEAPGGLRVYGAVRDITERKQAAAALRQQNEMRLTILDNIPVMVAFLDREGHHQYVNRCWQSTLGWSLEETLHKDVLAEIYPDPAYREHVLNSIRRAAGSWSDFETRTREGRVLDTSWANVPLLDGSNIGIGIDITERQRAEQALQASIKQLRALAKQLQRVREEERKMLAREIHDELGQTLTGLKMDLAWLKSNLPPAMEPEPLLLSETMDSMVELADRSIQEVRRLITQLRPPVLDNLGLEAAIEWQVGDLRQRTGIAGEFVSSLKGLTLDPNLATALFRILQEALTNVARHALATHIKIRLGKNDGALLLEIEDNGRGITASELEDSQSFGIMGMRERALVFGGEVNFIGQPGKGTTVRVLIPLESP